MEIAGRSYFNEDDLSSMKTKLLFISTTLPNSEKAVARYFADHLPLVAELNMKDISRKSNMSGSTIVRFCKRVGYNGFLDFQNQVRSASLRSKEAPEKEKAPYSVKEVMESIIRKNDETMRNTVALVSNTYDEVVRVLLSARTIVMYGNGDAIIPCNLFQIQMMKMGKTCTTYSDQDLQVFSSDAIHQKDVVVAVSHTGRSRSVVEATRIAHSRGIKTIAITSAAKSPLTMHCDYCLYAGTVDDSEMGDIISRRVAERLILETLFQCIRLSNDSDVTLAQKQAHQKVREMGHIEHPVDG